MVGSGQWVEIKQIRRGSDLSFSTRKESGRNFHSSSKPFTINQLWARSFFLDFTLEGNQELLVQMLQTLLVPSLRREAAAINSALPNELTPFDIFPALSIRIRTEV